VDHDLRRRRVSGCGVLLGARGEGFSAERADEVHAVPLNPPECLYRVLQ